MTVAIDITIFKEAIRRLCAFFNASHEGITFNDKGGIPVFVLPVIALILLTLLQDKATLNKVALLLYLLPPGGV